MEASVHLLAVSPAALILEHMDWWEGLFQEPLALVDGEVVLPERPGIGFALDRQAVDRYRAR
jgi:L-alanine-DL-glutamate epimerase-like enolase superfamily enzyme